LARDPCPKWSSFRFARTPGTLILSFSAGPLAQTECPVHGRAFTFLKVRYAHLGEKHIDIAHNAAALGDRRKLRPTTAVEFCVWSWAVSFWPIVRASRWRVTLPLAGTGEGWAPQMNHPPRTGRVKAGRVVGKISS